ncbi:MAG: CdaR family protein [bacterium]
MKRFRDILLKDFWIKAFSLVFAFFLWFSIVGGESAEEVFPIPLTIVNIPENMIIKNDIADFVNVRIRGQKAVLNSLNVKQIAVELNLKDAKEGENIITLFPEEVKLYEGLSVARISPSQVTVELSKLAEKWLPVETDFFGTVAKGYELGKVAATPSRVEVMGLQDALKDQEKIKTARIDLFGKDRSFSVEVDLRPLSGNVYIKGHKKVQVDVDILEKTGKREFRDIPVKGGSSDGAALRPDKVTLVLSGPEAGLAKMLPAMIEVVIQEPETPGIFQMEPEVRLPDGFQVIRIIPEKIRVKVKKHS